MNYHGYCRDEFCFDPQSLIECGTLRTGELVNMFTGENSENSFCSNYHANYGLNQRIALEQMLVEEQAEELNPEDDAKDVYTELAEKDHYLMLAAEAGKVLLEKNQELERQYELLHNEYVQKIEELEQERHFLKQELSSRDSTYESRIVDLQSDLDHLGNQLIMVQRSSHSIEKSQKSSYHDLSEQNELLRQQLNEVRSHNQALASQVQTLSQRIEGRVGSPAGADVVGGAVGPGRQLDAYPRSSSVRSAKDEVFRLSEQKQMLEESIGELVHEREMILADRNTSFSKLSLLEQELVELKQQIHVCQQELDSSKQKNRQLTEQLDELVMSQVFVQEQATNENSLFNELEMSLSEADKCVRSEDLESTPKQKRQRQVSLMDEPPNADGDDRLTQSAYYKLVEDLCDVYRKLKKVQQQLSDDNDGAAEETDDEIEAKLLDGVSLMKLIDAVIELIHERVLVLGLIDGGSDSPANTRSDSPGCIMDDEDSLSGNSETQGVVEILEHQVRDLNNRLNCKTNEAEELKKALASAQQAVQENEQQAQDLSLKTNAQTCELLALRKEREILLADVSVEDKLKKALEERDSAMKGEIEVRTALEQAHSDMRKLSNQLIAAAQHKLQLSEQLEQWQFDMAALIDKQLEANISREQNRVRPPRHGSNGSFFSGKLNFHFQRKQKLPLKLATPGNQSPSTGRN